MTNWINVNDSLPPVGVESVCGSAWVLISYLFDGKQYEGEGRYIKTDKTPIGRMYMAIRC